MNKVLKGLIVTKYGSQFAFALALGEHESAISKVLHGRRPLDSEGKKKWARALDCNDPKVIFEPAGE